MFRVSEYLEALTLLLRQKFGGRLLYVGLQGSYLRKEATETSDIDIMVILDGLTVPDLEDYRDSIFSLEDPEKSCGFLCGKDDLANWNPLEICHLLHTTQDYYGVLKDFVPAYTQQDVRNFVKLSVNNLYHELCHRYIHASRERNISGLPATYKGVFFILQNLFFLQTGTFVPTKAELLPLLSGKDRSVLERAIQLRDGDAYNFPESFELLFSWCQDTLKLL